MRELVVFVFDFMRDSYKPVLRTIWIPLIAGICVAFGFCSIPSKIIQDYYSNAVTVLGVLIGFSLSYFAIILSANSEEFNLAKDYYGEESNGKKQKLSLYQKEVGTTIFVILTQVVLLVVDLFTPFIVSDYQSKWWLLAINVFGILFILALLFRCVLDAYLIVTTTRTR